MRQYRITTEHLNQASDDDCYLAPDDPIHELKITSYMGGLGSTAKLEQYKIQSTMQRLKNESK